MSSSHIHTSTTNTSSSKGGGTVIQRRQRNTNTTTVGSNTGGGTSTSTTSMSYNHPHPHHNSYYYGGRGIGGSGSSNIDGGSASSLSSSMRERLSSTNRIPPISQSTPPPHSSSQLYSSTSTNYNNTIEYPVTSPTNQLQHVALHIDNNNNNYDHNNNHHNRYYKNGDQVMDRLNNNNNNNHYYPNHDNNYDPEQPHLHSPSSSYSNNTTPRMTEEQIRRFNTNYEQQQHHHQPLQSTISSIYQTTTTPTTTTVMSTNTNSTKPIPIWKRKMVLEEDFYRIEDYHTIFRNPHHMTDAQYTKYVQLQQHYMVHGNNNNNNNNNNSTTTPSMMNKTCCAYTCSMFSALAVFFLLWVGILLDTQPLYIPGALPTITVQSVTQQQQQQQQEPPYSSTTNQRNDYKQRQQKGQNRQQQQQQQKQSQSRRTTPRIQFIIPGKNDERLLIAKTAYQAATMYFITMIISRYIYDPIPFHTFYNTYILSVFQRCYSRMTGQRGFSMNSQRHSYTDIPELQSQYDMIGHYASNPAVSSSSSMEGLILAGTGGTNIGNGITLLPYANATSSGPIQPRSVWFSSSPSYTTATTSLWTRTSNTMKRYLASKGWYQPSRRRNRHHYEIKKTG